MDNNISQDTTLKEDWLNKKWRPAMDWMYMVVCLADFVLFPILWSIIQALANKGVVSSQWNPVTLQGAGLFHLAMGAVLGVTAFGRTQEKISNSIGYNNNLNTSRSLPSFGITSTNNPVPPRRPMQPTPPEL